MDSYSELKVRIERDEDDAFKVSVAGPSGEATGTFQVPLSDVELENLVLRISRPRRGVRRVDSPEMELIRRFGNDLFNSVFQSRVRDVYRDSYAQARAEGKGLRVTLALSEAPDLMNLPWEFLYDDPAFLSISTLTPIVRYLNLPRARQPLPVKPPLRVLAMISAPTDAVVLDVEHEKRLLEEALADLETSGGVEITWLEDATLRALQRQLRRGPYHVFHFIGHGGYDHVAEDGVLLLEDDQGRGRRVSGSHLGTMLADHTTLRLAVLNACEGARTSVEDPFAGVAASLVQREIPAVIGMQFEITDRAAVVFAEEFYSALADGYPADSAVAEARKAVFAEGNDIEWGTPVLFMRVPDGRIFDFVPGPVHAEPELQVVAPVPAVEDLSPAVEPVEAKPEDVTAAPSEPETQPELEPVPVPVPEPEPEPESAARPRTQTLPLEGAGVPALQAGPASAPVSTPVVARSPRRTRPIAVALALTGAVVGLAANALPTNAPIVENPGLAPETLGVPLLVAVVAILLQLGRVRDGLAYGLFLGFGILTVAGAVSIGALSVELNKGWRDAAIALVAAGACFLAAALPGIRGLRAPAAWSRPFRWRSGSLLAIIGVLVGTLALFVPFGRLHDDGTNATVLHLGDANGLTALALEPIVALVAAGVAAYALGKGGAVGLVAAGFALALGAQTMLFYGTLVGAVASEHDSYKPELGAGAFVGFAAAALFLAAGLLGRRSAVAAGLTPVRPLGD
jgi:CHAT domain